MAEGIENGFAKMGLETARRHVFLCGGPECCAVEVGQASWETLKAEVARAQVPVLRTRAACLRVCRGGPWLVVYPEGIWYGGVTPENCRRIVQEHLLGGRIIEEWVVRKHPFPGEPGVNGMMQRCNNV
jgi:(2Fe-2S) ferredoxin